MKNIHIEKSVHSKSTKFQAIYLKNRVNDTTTNITQPLSTHKSNLELIIDELSKSGSNMMIGPRYKFPCNNINRIIKQNGPFDALLIDPGFLLKAVHCPMNIFQKMFTK